MMLFMVYRVMSKFGFGRRRKSCGKSWSWLFFSHYDWKEIKEYLRMLRGIVIFSGTRLNTGFPFGSLILKILKIFLLQI